MYVWMKPLTDNGVSNCCLVYLQDRETLKRVFSGISSIRTDFCTYFLLYQFPEVNSYFRLRKYSVSYSPVVRTVANSQACTRPPFVINHPTHQ